MYVGHWYEYMYTHSIHKKINSVIFYKQINVETSKSSDGCMDIM